MPHTARKYQFEDVVYFELGKSFIPFNPAPMTVYCFYIDGLLIDTGQKTMQKQLCKLLEPYPITQIALTHYHEDHSGNTHALAQKYQVPVYASPLTAQKIGYGFKILPYEKLLFGTVPTHPDIQPLPQLLQTSKHQLLPIHTPGHSADHYVFLEQNKGWLFAGDFYLGKLRYFRKEEDIAQHIQSLKKILHYDFDVLFCAHYPSLKNGKALVKAKLQYLEDFYEKVASLYALGKETPEIMQELKLKEIKLLKLVTFNDVGVNYMVLSVIDNQKMQIEPVKIIQ